MYTGDRVEGVVVNWRSTQECALKNVVRECRLDLN